MVYINARHRRLISHVAALTTIVVFLCGCGLERPQAPSFETEAHVPIGDLSYTVAELIESEERIEGDTTGTHPVYLTYDGLIDSVDVAESLTTDVEPVFLSAAIGELNLEIPDTYPVSFAIGDIVPITIPPGGAWLIVPSFNMSDLIAELPHIPEFREGVVASGSLIITLHNDLPVTIREIVLQIEDITFGETIETIVRPTPVSPGGMTNHVVDLSGKRISNHYRVTLVWTSSPGSDVPVLVRETDEIRIETQLSGLRFSEIEAPIPAQSFAENASTPLGETIQIQGGRIADTEVPLRLESTVPLPVSVELLLPDLLEEGEPWSRSYPMPAGSTGIPSTLILDEQLLGSEIAFADLDTPQMFRYQLLIEYEGSGGEVIGLSQEMGVVAEIGAFELNLDEFTGVVRPLEIAIPPSTTSFSIPDETDGIEFLEATLTLQIVNEAQIPGRLALTVSGTSEKGSAAVHLDGGINSATPSGPSLTRLQWDQKSSNVLDLLNLHPEEISIEGFVIAGDSTVVGTATSRDRIVGSYEVRSALRVQIHETTYKPDAFDFEIPDEIEERVGDEIRDAHAELIVHNHLPIGVTIALQFADDSTSVYKSPHVTLNTVRVEPGELDPVTGRVTANTRSEVSIDLSTEDIDFFAKDKAYGGVLIIPDQTRDQFVELQTTDKIDISGVISFRMRMD